MGIDIGIDLGTTNSAMAHVLDGEPEIIENFEGKETTPSVVQFKEDGDVLVGDQADRNRVVASDEVVTRIKDHMGKTGEYTTTIHGTDYRPDEVSKYILEKLKTNAEDKTGEEVDGAVITVPYYFGEAARKATKSAGELAGLEVYRVMNEPTAAVRAYGFDQENDGDTVLVYDLGGGTFDATVITIEAVDDDMILRVEGSDGNEELGGEVFDDALYEHIADEFVSEGFADPDDNPNVRQNLRMNAKEAKEDLSTASETTVAEMMGTETFSMSITRETFNDLVADKIDGTITTIEDDIFGHDNVDVEKSDIDDVLLVGGSTRIPLVRETIEDYFGFEPSSELSPDKAVAMGAALEAAEYDEDYGFGGDSEGETYVVDVLSHSLGVGVYESGNTDGPLIFDPIFQKNDEIPGVEEKEGYTTAHDNITTVEVPILEGEGDTVDDEDVDEIGKLELELAEPVPAGEPNFRVTFDIDDDNILTAEAEDVDTGKTAEATIDTISIKQLQESSGHLSQFEERD